MEWKCVRVSRERVRFIHSSRSLCAYRMGGNDQQDAEKMCFDGIRFNGFVIL
jgi:hypothetical protein